MHPPDIPDALLRDLARAPIIPEDVLERAPSSIPPDPELTPAERRVLELYSHGVTTPMIADMTGSTYESVKDRAKRARYKLRAKTTAHAACIAIRRGLIN